MMRVTHTRIVQPPKQQNILEDPNHNMKIVYYIENKKVVDRNNMINIRVFKPIIKNGMK